MAKRLKSFGDYKADGNVWITLTTGEYYPDILVSACELYKPVLVIFSEILKRSEDSTARVRFSSRHCGCWTNG